ncbi:hypothetical protein D9M69_623610 [compost metagenome]
MLTPPTLAWWRSRASSPKPIRKPPSTEATQGLSSSKRTTLGASVVQADTRATAPKLLKVNAGPSRTQESTKNGRLNRKKNRPKGRPVA